MLTYWLRPWSKKFSQISWKKLILIIQTNNTNMQFLIVAAYQVRLAKKKSQQLRIWYLFKSTKTSNDILMNEMQPLVSEKCRFDSQEKSKLFHFMLLSAGKVCNVMTFFRSFIIEFCSNDRIWLAETMMDEKQKVVPKRIKSVHQDNSYKKANIDNFCLSSFRLLGTEYINGKSSSFSQVENVG